MGIEISCFVPYKKILPFHLVVAHILIEYYNVGQQVNQKHFFAVGIGMDIFIIQGFHAAFYNVSIDRATI
jgi:hypothetical protein